MGRDCDPKKSAKANEDRKNEEDRQRQTAEDLQRAASEAAEATALANQERY